MGLLSLLIGYLLGSIPSGFLAGRWLKNIDLRTIGSGSTGATAVACAVTSKNTGRSVSRALRVPPRVPTVVEPAQHLQLGEAR